MTTSRRVHGSRPTIGNLILMVRASDPAAFWEGFCPNCPGTTLAGDCRNWCPSCRTFWIPEPAAQAPPEDHP